MDRTDRSALVRAGAMTRERRGHARFPLSLDVRYSALRAESGSGRIIDISKTGVRIAAQGPQEPGSRLDIAINWPVLLEGRVPLQLLVVGKVVWSSQTEVALQIYRHAFRTRSVVAGVAQARAVGGNDDVIDGWKEMV